MQEAYTYTPTCLFKLYIYTYEIIYLIWHISERVNRNTVSKHEFIYIGIEYCMNKKGGS